MIIDMERKYSHTDGRAALALLKALRGESLSEKTERSASPLFDDYICMAIDIRSGGAQESGSFISILKESISGAIPHAVIYFRPENRYYCAVGLQSSQNERRLCEEVLRAMENSQVLTDSIVYMGISLRKQSITQLSDGLNEAADAAESRFYRHGKHLLAPPAGSTKEDRQFHALLDQICKKEYFTREYVDYDAAYEDIGKLMKLSLEQAAYKISPQMLKQRLLGVLYDLLVGTRSLLGDGGVCHARYERQMYDKIALSASFPEAVRHALWYIRDMKRSTADCNEQNHMVRLVKKYIRLHYMKNLTLSDVAEYIGVSPNYFCYYFKRMTGENFSAYLRKVRIEEAIKLIKQDQFSTEEVSERVGYSNSNYFIKVFKSFTGKTLCEFKMQHIKTPPRRTDSLDAAAADVL